MNVRCILLLLFLCRPPSVSSWSTSNTSTSSPTSPAPPASTPAPYSAIPRFFMGAVPSNSWDAAAAYCSANGASLASILNQADFDAAVTACTRSVGCWTGLRQDSVDGWVWDNDAPLTYFGFDEGGPTVGVAPWASNNPVSGVDECVCLMNDVFTSCVCGLDGVYPLCSKAKFEVILEHKNINNGFFSSTFLSSGIENADDASANTFSAIGLQGDGEHLRYGGGEQWQDEHACVASSWTDLDIADQDECIEACRERADCGCVTWMKDNAKKCRLEDGTTTRDRGSGAPYAAILVGNPFYFKLAYETVEIPSTSTDCQWRDEYACVSSSWSDQNIADKDDCIEACRQSSSCGCVTWMKNNANKCRFEDGTTMRDRGSGAPYAAVLMAESENCVAIGEWRDEHSCVSSSWTDLNIADKDDCIEACNERADCGCVTWMKDNAKKCRLEDGTTTNDRGSGAPYAAFLPADWYAPGTPSSQHQLVWEQSSWLTETTRSGAIMHEPQRCGPAGIELYVTSVDAHLEGDVVGECRGDCDDDLHCSGDLMCFQRETGDSPAVPGCIGDAYLNWDYCYQPCDGSFDGLGRSSDNDLSSYLIDGEGNRVGSVSGDANGIPSFSGNYAKSQTLYVYVDGSGSGDGHISVTACDNYDPASPTGQMSIMLRGTNGTTPLISVNGLSALPTNGETFTFDVAASELSVGQLIGVSLSVNDLQGYCLKAISIVSDVTSCRGEQGACNFGAEYFGRGMVLKSRGTCESTFVDVLGEDEPLLTCYDEGFLDLHTNTNRGVVDLSIHSCNLESGGINALSDGELSVVLTGKEGISTTFTNSEVVELTISDYWAVNTYRRFEINVEAPLTTVALARLMYGGADGLCVDLLFANGRSSTYLSDNWLGNGDDDSQSLTAVFKWPVCATEVINVRVDSDYSSADVQNGASFISGLDCSNYNRIVSSTCAISQSYDTSKSTSYSFAEETSTETSTNSDYSWGREDGGYKETMSSSSDTTANEFAYGFTEEITVGAEAEVGAVFAKATASVDVSVGAHQDWTRSSERTETTERTSGSTWGKNKAWSKGSGTSTGSGSVEENEWESTQSSSVTCEASMEVPPSHSVKYSLLFNAFTATIRTYSDMKLTMCSALLREGGETGDDHVIIENIPGTIQHSETTACEVQFEPAQYLPNEVGCAEEEKLAIAAGATYIPRCNEDEPAQYDTCQCDIGDSKTMGVCWCSDEQGNPSDARVYQFGDEWSDAQVCAALGCPGYYYTTTTTTTSTTSSSDSDEGGDSSSGSGSNAAAQEELGDGDELKVESQGAESAAWTDSVDVELLNDLLLLMTILVSVATVAIAMYVANKCWKWVSVGASQSVPSKSVGTMEPSCRVELTAVEEEHSQVTV